MLFEQGQTLLAAAVALLEDAPERQFVAEGEVADDCGQVTVRLMRIFNGTPGAEGTFGLSAAAMPCVVQRTAEWEVRVSRCAATGTPVPSPEAIDSAAEVGLDDLDALLGITPDSVDVACQGFLIVSGSTSGPAGGARASLVIVQIGLN